MTADELRALLEAVPISQRAAAKQLGIHDRLMRRYCSPKGNRKIPPTDELKIRLHFQKPHTC